VKQALTHGEFKPWVIENCSFSYAAAHQYMTVAKAKIDRAQLFKSCNSIREVLALGKPKTEPVQETRAATLDDLRKVERLRALRDSPAATEGEREAAQRKLDDIEREVGPVEPKPNVYDAMTVRGLHTKWKEALRPVSSHLLQLPAWHHRPHRPGHLCPAPRGLE